MIRFACSGCGKNIQTKDEHAGKKVRCPACQAVQVVPKAAPPEEEPLEVVEAADDEAPRPKPAARSSAIQKSPSSAKSSSIQKSPSASKKPARRRPDDDDDDDEDEDEDDRPRGRRRPSRRRGAFADCPHCGCRGDASRVTWTLWGGFIGPWLLTHVRCHKCGSCYNGSSGKDNTVAIILYIVIPSVIGLGCGLVAAVFSAMSN